MVRIAIVGAWGIANRHTEAIKAIDDAGIVAVVDVIKEKLASHREGRAIKILPAT